MEAQPSEISREYFQQLDRMFPFDFHSRHKGRKDWISVGDQTWAIQRTVRNDRFGERFWITLHAGPRFFDEVTYIIDPENLDTPFLREGVSEIQGWETLSSDGNINLPATIEQLIKDLSPQE